MRLPAFLLRPLRRWATIKVHTTRPDFVIGGDASPYLSRWFVIPRNRWFNIYLHHIRRSDDDRALHDHPWVNCSILLDGGYCEWTIAAGGIENAVIRQAGDMVFRLPGAAHRLELPQQFGHGAPTLPAISLFITGPRVRQWGFHCPKAGWVHWQDFTAGPNGETVGRGCDQ
jgi:hypothetical protein